jgi:hypothetical protein
MSHFPFLKVLKVTWKITYEGKARARGRAADLRPAISAQAPYTSFPALGPIQSIFPTTLFLATVSLPFLHPFRPNFRSVRYAPVALSDLSASLEDILT